MPRTRHLIVHGPDAVARHLPTTHPLKPGRADDALRLLLSANIVGPGAVPVHAPSRIADIDLLRVHDATYIDVADRLSRDPSGREPPRVSGRDEATHGFSRDGDNPPYFQMTEAARHACGGVLDAARHVLASPTGVAFVPSAGANHHAKRARASGFGIFNDAAVAIAAIRSSGTRVAYVDLDVHHGDGVEAAFATDPGTLTISVHESTRYLFPGPPGGLADQIGVGAGVGTAVNVPLAPYTDDEAWLEAFEAIVPPLLGAFRADLTVVQCGADGYHADPLAHLLLSERAYISAAARLRDISGGRLVMIGGGGYDPEATARIWASMFATFIDTPLPPDWLGRAPPVLDDQASARVAVENDAAVRTVQELVFPRHGIEVPVD